MENILILRLSSLGDIIHTLPAFSALRRNFPQANISWLVEENGKQILDLVTGIDRIIIFKGKKWKIYSKQFKPELSQLIKEIKNPDQIVLDFQGLIKSAFLAYLSRAKKRIGFHRKNLREPFAARFYTHTLEETSESEHVISKNLKLLSLLGIQETAYDFSLTIPDNLTEKTSSVLRTIGFNGKDKIILMNVGAAWETKKWPAEKWSQLAEGLCKKKKNIFPLLLWGNEIEKELAESVQKMTGIASVPALSIQEVMALINQTDLVISGDTFAMQVACALSRPIVGIFGPTNPKRNGPFDPKDKIVFHETECSFCYKRKCSNLKCLDKTTPEEAINVSLKILKENE